MLANTKQQCCLAAVGSDDTPMAELPDKIPFFSGIPVVEVTRGVIHLFRDR